MSIMDPMLNVLSDQSYTTVTNTVFADPVIGSSLLSDMAHLVLDFATFYVKTNDTMLLQLLTIIGRILTIGSDYLPDNEIAPDEFLFQFFMFGWSLKSWTDDIHSIVQANQRPASFQERRFYRTVFFPAGMTWYQYRAFMSEKMALVEWVHMQPGDTILQDNHDDCIYLLYQGDVVQIFDDSSGLKKQQDKQLRYFSQGRNSNYSAHILIYERALAMKLLERRTASKTRHTSGTKPDHLKHDRVNDLSYNGKTNASMMEAGEKGASLLRVDVNKLLKLVEHDSHLALSIQKILLYESLKTQFD